MNLFQVNELTTENLKLKRISNDDKSFIEGLFNDNEIKKYYIVPKEARQNYRMLISYWLNDIKNGAGCAWVIIEKGKGFFASDKKCGFVAFEFRNSTENARISYALLPEHRGKGIASKSVSYLMELLEKSGVISFEADIDRDNLKSEKVVERLGFTANKRQALVDPEMMRDGEIRMRALWKKDLRQNTLKQSASNSSRIPTNASINEIVPEINRVAKLIEQNGQHPELVVKYLYLLGRIKFLEGNYEEATDAFGQCNMITMNHGMPDNYENFYWFARMREEKGESKADIIMYYNFALEKYYNNPELISREEILAAKNKV